MDSIAVGKLLPNLKVTIGNEERKDEKIVSSILEESVNSDEDGKKVKIVRSWMNSLQNPKVYKNKGGAFTTGVDLLSEYNSGKLDKRAERFGLELDSIVDSLTPENISSLYKSIGIDIENKDADKNIRLDALHVRGINEMNTNEMFKYFQDYGPASVEWINDYSCNVVWLDETTCARALLGMSKPLKESTSKDEGTKKSDVEESEEPMDVLLDDNCTAEAASNKDEKLTDTEPIKEKKDASSSDEEIDLDIPVPPGYWRLGMPHPKAKCILLRFATKDDKKMRGAEKRSEFYKKYGNPNYGGLRGLISASRKQKMLAMSNKKNIQEHSGKLSDHSSDKDVVVPAKPRVPRMRMYADDEEQKARISRYTEITEKQSVHSRLGKKYTKEDLFYIGTHNVDVDRSSSSERDDYEPRGTRDRHSLERDYYQTRTKWRSEREDFLHRERLSLEKDNYLYREYKEKSLGIDKDRSSGRYQSQSVKDRLTLDKGRKQSRSVKDRLTLHRDQTQSKSIKDRLTLPKDMYPSGGFQTSRRKREREERDLCQKIRKLKTDSDVSKHRSPLCKDD